MLNSEVAAWVAQAAFWVLILLGWSDLSGRTRAIFLGSWLGAFALRVFVPFGDVLFTPVVALLAVCLVLAIFKRDIPI